MQRRLIIKMDHENKILPDKTENYIVGVWDGSMEAAIDNAIKYFRNILVLRDEGIDLTLDQLYGNKIESVEVRY